MAGDWIKMRISLPSDPKVIAIANILAEDRRFINWLTHPVQMSCNESAYECVTSCVTRSVTVTALLKVWGVVSQTCKRDNECDARVTHANIYTIDDIADVPGFGEAMEAVGWVIEEDNNLIFPNFLMENSSAEERKENHQRELARIRKRRQRERDNERDMSVTCHDKRREEKSIVQPPPTPPPEQPSSMPPIVKQANDIICRTGIPSRSVVQRLLSQVGEVGEERWLKIITKHKTEISKADGPYWNYMLTVVENHKDDPPGGLDYEADVDRDGPRVDCPFCDGGDLYPSIKLPGQYRCTQCKRAIIPNANNGVPRLVYKSPTHQVATSN